MIVSQEGDRVLQRKFSDASDTSFLHRGNHTVTFDLEKVLPSMVPKPHGKDKDGDDLLDDLI